LLFFLFTEILPAFSTFCSRFPKCYTGIFLEDLVNGKDKKTKDEVQRSELPEEEDIRPKNAQKLILTSPH
jgi:hypothetical protein